MERTLLDFKELCERYPFKPWTIRTYCSQGKIPFIRIGRRVFFRIEDIERWLKDHTFPVQEINLG